MHLCNLIPIYIAESQLYKYPGAVNDELFDPNYQHRNHGSSPCCYTEWYQPSDPIYELALTSSCDETACADNVSITRPRPEMRRGLDEQGRPIGI